MKRVLVFQHVAHEILGTFHPLLKEAGIRIRYANFDRHPNQTVEMGRYDGLIILGGPMGVYETAKYPHLNYEIKCVRDAIHRGKPVFGICLGAQLIAAALGATVAPCPTKEIGWYDVGFTEEGEKDPILGGLGKSQKLFQWHGDAFTLPPGATWLASSPGCAYQAFRYADNVYGFQFHLEVCEPMIDRWLTLPSSREQLDAVGGSEAARRIQTETPKHIANLKELSRQVFTRYIERFGTTRKKIVLRSGDHSDE